MHQRGQAYCWTHINMKLKMWRKMGISPPCKDNPLQATMFANTEMNISSYERVSCISPPESFVLFDPAKSAELSMKLEPQLLSLALFSHWQISLQEILHPQTLENRSTLDLELQNNEDILLFWSELSRVLFQAFRGSRRSS